VQRIARDFAVELGTDPDDPGSPEWDEIPL
jgi:hypothetical protein